MPDRSDEFRDDTICLTGAGPLTQELDDWQPMHVAADMPLPYDVQRGQLIEAACDALANGNQDAVCQIVGQLAALRDRNTNSGPAAPIQGQG